MNVRVSPDAAMTERNLPFERIALVLQGGGALGAYQAGVYEALAESGIQPDWVAGISIGGINAAIIAGNPANTRVDRLREFWTQVTSDTSRHWFGWPEAKGDGARNLLNHFSANLALMQGAISVGAVNVRTGNFVYFDTTTHTIQPEHVMASGALPPGFPAIEIEGEHYWDGGLVSNTPLQWVVDSEPRRDTLTFQVDLWSAQGDFPRTMLNAMTREKEIRYSSRTRAGTDQFKRVQKLRCAVAGLLEQLPEHLKDSPEARLLGTIADRKVFNIVHLIYRARNYEGHSKDYEFSRASMEEHWRAGYHDARRTLRHPEVLERPRNLERLFTFDLAQGSRE
jgi:NTE family protein